MRDGFRGLLWGRAGCAENLSALLAPHRPCMIADKSGGWTTYPQTQESEVPIERSNASTSMNPQPIRGTPTTIEMGPSFINGLGTLAAQLDSLSADRGPDDLCQTLRSTLAKPELYMIHLAFLAEDEPKAKVMLDVFDKALKAPQNDNKIFEKFRQLCGRAGLLPASYVIPENLITTWLPITFGTFSNVWGGIYNGRQVAIKALRVYKDEDVRKVRKVFCEEAAMWKRISHPNIVPFLGVSSTPAPLSMVSEWMPNGNVREYVVKNPETSRIQLLLDISRGMSFLHSIKIAHGDLRGDNVLVDKSGCARLVDYGFFSIANLNCTETSALGSKGTYRWMAPELLSVEGHANRPRSPTFQSDVFALGMVVIEVFTGEVPFPKNKSFAVAKKIVDGEQPPRPATNPRLRLSDELWKATQSSWTREADRRPSVSMFVDLLERANPDIALLRELTTFHPSSEEHLSNLQTMFDYGENALLGMRENESVILIEALDQVLNSSLVDDMIRSRCLRGLHKVSARCGILPNSYFVTRNNLIQPDVTLSITGRVSDTCEWEMNEQPVAVKTINPEFIGDSDTFRQRLFTHAVMWKRLGHPNVATFLGFCSGSPPFSLVYPWMPNGTLSEYVNKYPNADKFDLLSDVARGLAYLHHYNLVHGNLTGNNILVDANGVARITEYGLELVLREVISPNPIPVNIRWTAPELIVSGNKNKPLDVDGGKRADIYSLAMVMFEILTGIMPFQTSSEEEIMDGVMMGLRPEWPFDDPSEGLANALRRLVEVCWSHDPEERPTALVVLQTISTLSQEGAREETQGLQELSEYSDGDAWDRIEGAPELAPEHPKRHKVVGKPKRKKSFQKILGEGIRNLLHLPKPGSVAVDKKRESGVETVGQRGESGQTSQGNVVR